MSKVLERFRSFGKKKKKKDSPDSVTSEKDQTTEYEAEYNNTSVTSCSFDESQLTSRHDTNEVLPLVWRNCYPLVSTESEKAVLRTLIPWGNTERGMMKDHRLYRVEKISEACSKHGMQLEQALSLRRYYIKVFNSEIKNMTHLGLGSDHHIHGTANLFKQAVFMHLKQCGTPFLTRDEHKLAFFEEGKPFVDMPQIPEFMLSCPVHLISYQPSRKGATITEHAQINWIHTQMFYGAYTRPCQSNNNASSVLRTAKKYIKDYGAGAFVFVYGCGSDLNGQLKDLGVSVLDSNPLDLTEMQNYRKGWCANKDGLILP